LEPENYGGLLGGYAVSISLDVISIYIEVMADEYVFNT